MHVFKIEYHINISCVDILKDHYNRIRKINEIYNTTLPIYNGIPVMYNDAVLAFSLHFILLTNYTRTFKLPIYNYNNRYIKVEEDYIVDIKSVTKYIGNHLDTRFGSKKLFRELTTIDNEIFYTNHTPFKIKHKIGLDNIKEEYESGIRSRVKKSSIIPDHLLEGDINTHTDQLVRLVFGGI